MSPSISPRSSSRRSGRSTAAGFTLIEVLVAISMAAIVLTAVYGVFTSVSSAKIRLEADSEAYHRGRIVFDRLGREIRGAVPIVGTDGTGVFRGGLDDRDLPFLELTTTAVAQQVEGGTGIALIRYNLAEDREQPGDRILVLQRSEQPAFQNAATTVTGGLLRLAPGIERLQLRYYTGSDWRDDWNASIDGLPAMVELSLVMIDAEGSRHQFASAFELPGVAWKK